MALWLMDVKMQRPADPLSPDNCLIIALGPAADGRIWGSSRYGIFSRSPQTGLYGESYAGGRVAGHMSRTGYDAFYITGQSASPVALDISDGGVGFLDAADLWGMDTYTAQDALTARAGRTCGVVVIGPTGENLVRFSVVENDYWRSAGRTGMGAVLGSKKLKGLIFRGSTRRPAADPEILDQLFSQIAENRKDQQAGDSLKNRGTARLVEAINRAGAFPSRYWSAGRVENIVKINAETLHNRLKVTPRACTNCFLACGRLSEVLEGPHKGLKIEGPEYETIFAFGGLALIESIEEIAYLNDICDRLGMDTISAGNLAGLAIEASRRGKIKDKIDYGDADAVARLLRQIAFRRGPGAVLAQGTALAAAEWGLEDLAVQVKGLEPAGYDPRYFKTMALAYATTPRGACHLRASAFRAEMTGVIPREQVKGKARIVVDSEDQLTLHDALITCRFFRGMYGSDGVARLIQGLTGWTADKNDLVKLAVNIRNLNQRVNIKLGWTRQHDKLPKRFFKESIGEGIVLKPEEMEYMIDDYYRLRGWDSLGRPLEQDERPVLGGDKNGGR